LTSAKLSLSGSNPKTRYRVFAHLEKQADRFPIYTHYRDDGSQVDVTVWCSNDYLGMGQSPIVIDAAREAAARVGAGGTRNIAGTSHYHILLEEELAYLHAKEAALLSPPAISLTRRPCRHC
jgi:5-aminolevulinate synthase